MEECIFCNIIDRKLKAEILYEDNDCILIKDIHPKAPTHCLIIPKNHYPTIKAISKSNLNILLKIIEKIPNIAENVLGLKSGFRLIINQGSGGGQEVPHLHIHILGNFIHVGFKVF